MTNWWAGRISMACKAGSAKEAFRTRAKIFLLSDTDFVLWGGLGGIEHEDGSFRTLRDRTLGEESEALASLQRETLTGLAGVGTADREVLLALSLIKA
jgi:hypothetical protein